MNLDKVYDSFGRVFSEWENGLSAYSETQLVMQPAADSWSVGQVYIHLINATLGFHLKQIEVCLGSNDNRFKTKNMKGFMSMTVLNGFPDIKIKVPPSDLYTPKQPINKQQIVEGFAEVIQQMETSLLVLKKGGGKGKTKHPGLSFLNANEWFKLVEMHFRHHLRQKQRIDEFLKSEQNAE